MMNFKILLEAQEALNSKYVPNWRTEVGIEQFVTATFTESAEWFESAPRSGGCITNGVQGWKWWKCNLTDDNQNKRIEVIDVLHFLMSSWLKLSDIDNILDHISKYDPMTNTEYKNNLCEILETYAFYSVASLRQDVKMSIEFGLDLLGVLLRESSMSWNQLEDGYYLKNKLNHARVEGGYMSGEYSKHDEEGNEDNRMLDV